MISIVIKTSDLIWNVSCRGRSLWRHVSAADNIGSGGGSQPWQTWQRSEGSLGHNWHKQLWDGPTCSCLRSFKILFWDYILRS
jgi:hypothetical protein